MKDYDEFRIPIGRPLVQGGVQAERPVLQAILQLLAEERRNPPAPSLTESDWPAYTVV